MVNNTVHHLPGLWAWSFTFMFVFLKLTGQSDLNWFIVVSPALIRVAYVQGSMMFSAYRAQKHPEDIPQEDNKNEGTGHYV